ncbi:hypothetical protein M3Y99_00801100 [Aphelenchoides fujianensis]|nr:hypothetical protein M3Y99_00801100 [Aphelenchoides fujianensis]
MSARLKEPEDQHRARYLSEGSRGAIKDRSGSSHCTIQLTGYFRPTRVEMFAALGAGELQPHPSYRLIPVAGKTSVTTPCKKAVSHDGIECLEIKLQPETNMTAVLDCIGILKICSYDTKQQRRSRRPAAAPSKRSKSSPSCGQSEEAEDRTASLASTCTRVCLRAYVLDETKSNYKMLETCTQPIRCVQQLGVPEVLNFEENGARFGRRRTFHHWKKFRQGNHGTLCWSAEATIAKAFFHQCHIVCSVPAYPHLYRGGTVSITVQCGQKQSHPHSFVYLPCENEPEGRRVVPAGLAARPTIVQRNNRRAWAPPNNSSLTSSSYYSGFLDDSPVNTTASPKTFHSTTSAGGFFDFDHHFPSAYDSGFGAYEPLPSAPLPPTRSTSGTPNEGRECSQTTTIRLLNETRFQ